MTAHHTIDFHFATEAGRTGGQRLRGRKGKEPPPVCQPAPSEIPHPVARRIEGDKGGQAKTHNLR